MKRKLEYLDLSMLISLIVILCLGCYFMGLAVASRNIYQDAYENGFMIKVETNRGIQYRWKELHDIGYSEFE